MIHLFRHLLRGATSWKHLTNGETCAGTGLLRRVALENLTNELGKLCRMKSLHVFWFPPQLPRVSITAI